MRLGGDFAWWWVAAFHEGPPRVALVELPRRSAFHLRRPLPCGVTAVQGSGQTTAMVASRRTSLRLSSRLMIIGFPPAIRAGRPCWLAALLEWSGPLLSQDSQVVMRMVAGCGGWAVCLRHGPSLRLGRVDVARISRRKPPQCLVVPFPMSGSFSRFGNPCTPFPAGCCCVCPRCGGLSAPAAYFRGLRPASDPFAWRESPVRGCVSPLSGPNARGVG